MVVLPFVNIGGDPEQEHFVDGVTESLTTDLSRLRRAVVIARNTAFTYKGKPLDVKMIGRELNVRYVLEGRCCGARRLFPAAPGRKPNHSAEVGEAPTRMTAITAFIKNSKERRGSPSPGASKQNAEFGRPASLLCQLSMQP